MAFSSGGTLFVTDLDLVELALGLVWVGFGQTEATKHKAKKQALPDQHQAESKPTEPEASPHLI